MEGFLKKVALWLEKIRSAPVIGGMVEDLITMTQLLSDCTRGIYEKLPRWTVFGILAALFYAFSPIDLILDFIPLAGFLDDAAVIGLVLELGLARDLMQYREWKKQRRSEEIDRYRKQLAGGVPGPDGWPGAGRGLSDRRPADPAPAGGARRPFPTPALQDGLRAHRRGADRGAGADRMGGAGCLLHPGVPG